jgi:hypothetical protein
MPTETPTKPVDNPVSKVNNELDVGADMEFQKRWWRFENIVWIAFTVVILLDLAGAFGRGPLAKAQWQSSNGNTTVKYDRIERYSTPSVITITAHPAAIRDGKIQVWVSDSLLKEFGMERLVPEPVDFKLDHHGILFTFPSASIPDSLYFSLQPKTPGLHRFTLRVADSEELNAKVLVMP